jgi:hypothetical protein
LATQIGAKAMVMSYKPCKLHMASAVYSPIVRGNADMIYNNNIRWNSALSVKFPIGNLWPISAKAMPNGDAMQDKAVLGNVPGLLYFGMRSYIAGQSTADTV